MSNLVSPPVTSLLPLVGRDVRVLHPAPGTEQSTAGGDVDCAASDVDPLWPLRLTSLWRVCQHLHYAVRGHCWVVEYGEEFLALDVLVDPEGVNALAFPTSLAIAGAGPLAPPSSRAAYLTAKRIRKHRWTERDWRQIGELARDEPERYLAAMEEVLGAKLAARVSRFALAGEAPPRGLRWQAFAAQAVRPVRDPRRAALVTGLVVARVAGRVWRPTGVYVVVAGPDGVGKSTVAASLAEGLQGPLKRHLHLHWRPGVLPSPGHFLGRRPNSSQPHGIAPHGRLVSHVVLAYYWLDFVVGTWLRLWPTEIRAGLVVVERGWWDMVVDPARYRLQVGERTVRMLGRLVPQPDLLLILAASPDVLYERKTELSRAELARQIRTWHESMPRARRVADVDAAAPLEQVLHESRAVVLDLLVTRTTSRLGAGWTGLPSRRSPRWQIPRGPRPLARAGLLVYQPVTTRGRIGWQIARRLAAAGAFRLLPRGEAPPQAVLRAVAPYLTRGGTVAVARAMHPGRYVAALLGADGTCHAVAKVATNEAGRTALGTESSALHRFADLLPAPLAAPRVIAHEPELLLLEAVQWQVRARPWFLPAEVAHALGQFFSRGTPAGGQRLGHAHGDCAPWNLLQVTGGWVLIDWEDAKAEAEPFTDIFHYLVQAHALLGRPSRRALHEGLRGKGWIGHALGAYSEGAGVDVATAAKGFESYLESSARRLDEQTADGRAGLAARRSLLDLGPA